MGRAECGRAMEKRRANERDEQETKTIGKSTTKRKKTKAGNLYMRSYIVDYPPSVLCLNLLRVIYATKKRGGN